MNKIQRIRESLGLNKNQFAKLLGVPNSYISDYESGKANPGRKFISLLLQKIPNLNEAYFFDDNAKMYKDFKSFTYSAGSKDDYEQQIRKLQADIKRLEEENRILREHLSKISILTQTLEVSKKIKNKPKS